MVKDRVIMGSITGVTKKGRNLGAIGIMDNWRK